MIVSFVADGDLAMSPPNDRFDDGGQVDRQELQKLRSEKAGLEDRIKPTSPADRARLEKIERQIKELLGPQ